MINPAAPPCTTRSAISMTSDVDSAHAAEVSTKQVTPMMKIRLRPYRSPSLPPVISTMASASV
jgi:hypothetical protein